VLVLATAPTIASCSSCDDPAPPPEPRASPPPAAMAATSFRLDNGLEVELVTGPCGDEVAVTALFAVGADHDPPARSGLTHVLERAMQGSLGEADRFESARDHSVYSTVVAASELEAALDRLARRWRAPALGAEAVTRAKDEVLAELAQRRGGDATLTALSFAAESVHPSAGDGWRGGVATEVQLLEPSEVEAFWRAHYAARNARLVVVGRFDPAALRRHVEATFADVPAGEAPTAREPVEAGVTGTLVMGSAPTAVVLAVRAPAVTEPLFPAFLVLAGRVTGPADGRAWQARYDPLREPELLFVTGPIVPGERGEAAANALRASLREVVARPLESSDVTDARARFGRLLGVGELAPETCADDPRALAVARARRAQLGLRELDLVAALEVSTEEPRREVARRFERPTAVLGGGEIR
jgi:hypothetical protein